MRALSGLTSDQTEDTASTLAVLITETLDTLADEPGYK